MDKLIITISLLCTLLITACVVLKPIGEDPISGLIPDERGFIVVVTPEDIRRVLEKDVEYLQFIVDEDIPEYNFSIYLFLYDEVEDVVPDTPITKTEYSYTTDGR